MANFEQNLEAVLRARQRLDRADEHLYEARLSVQKEKSPTSLASVRAELADPTAAVARARAELAEAIATLHGIGDHRDVARHLSADLPVVLLPVRIETRFVEVPGRLELWLRVYPDDIHVHSFEPRLSVDEVSAGRDYWRALTAANRGANGDPEAAKQDAWTVLARKRGVQRARWVARETRPTGWTPGLAVADDALDFPELPDDKTHDWTRAPRTQLLPDRFVVQLYQGEEEVASVVGNLVPDTVFMGPDPFLAEEAFTQKGTSIEVDESFAWTTDFDRAVAAGLGVKIPMDDGVLVDGRIDRITVLGVLASVDPHQGSRMLEQHLRSQRYSRSGLSFLPRGTATNNTGKGSSAYARNDDVPEKGYDDGDDPAPLPDDGGSDGIAFARALGISPRVLDDVRHAGTMQAATARAMNRALYPATVGHFLEVLASPAISRTALPSVREFFTEHVTAAGALPSLRIGDQPYGTLVTSDLRAWAGDDRFASSLSLVLRQIQRRFSSIQRTKVAHVSRRGDPARMLLDILGLGPGSVTFTQRLAHLEDLPLSAANIADAVPDFTRKQKRVMTFLRSSGYAATGNPLLSTLAFYAGKSGIPPDYLVDRTPPSPTRHLDKLGTSRLNFIEWLAQVGAVADLEGHRLPGARPPRSVLYFLLRHSLLLSLQKAGVRLYREAGFDHDRLASEKSLYNVDPTLRDLTTWELLTGVPSKVDATRLDIRTPLGDHLLGLGRGADVVAELAEVRDALEELAELSTAELYQHLVDHVDLCSYRLDAWQTGLFQRRLAARRARRPEGVYLGAYGWVENLRIEQSEQVPVPRPLTPDRSQPVFRRAGGSGFVHTPSLNHATAAGVLYSGYRNRADAGRPGAFAVNLSSARVRRALQLYQGVQNDQPLEALLGYQFERALHDATTRDPSANLNQYILALREHFPIEGASLPQAGTEAQESVPAYPVVNGLKVAEATPAQLTEAGVRAEHLDLVRAEQEHLEDALDAVGDLVTAESVYQMVQGKSDRAAGLLNGFKNVELPADLEVDRTPRTSRLSVSNMLCIGLGQGAGGGVGPGWAERATPRSRVEPALNRWLASQVGDPERIVCEVSTLAEHGRESGRRRVKLSDLGVQPIDLVYAVGVDVRSGAALLEQWIHREYTRSTSVPAGARVSIRFGVTGLGARTRSVAEVLPLVRSLRLLVTTSRPASARDFRPRTREVAESVDELHHWDVEDLRTRVAGVLAELVALRDRVGSTAPNGRQPKTRANPPTLRELFDGYAADGRPVERLEGLPLTPSTVDRLVELVEAAPLYGIAVGDLDGGDPEEHASVVQLLHRAAAAWSAVERNIGRAEAAMARAAGAPNSKVAVSRYQEAARHLLGDDFVIVPAFRLHSADDVRRSLEQRSEQLLAFYSAEHDTTPALALETWVESLAPVRPNIRLFEQVRLVSESHGGEELELTAVQLPFREKDHWLSVEFPDTNPETGEPFEVTRDTLSVCVTGLEPGSTGGRQQVLVVDEWTEGVPNATEVTGVAFHYNQPNSTAPNALLVAVEPTGGDTWDWGVLTGILEDTLQRAKNRAVEPAQLLADPVLDVLTPMTVAPFDVHDQNVSLDFLAVDDDLVAQMQRHDFSLYEGL